MAGHGHHSFNGPPKPPVAHVPRVYRFTATALGAGMWFFVSRPDELRLEASDGSEHQRQDYEDCMLTNYNTAYVPGKEGRCRSPWPQAPLGPLNDYHVRLLLFPQQLQQGRHWAPILKDTWIRCSVHRAEEALELKQKIQLRLESAIMISWESTGWNCRIKTAACRLLMVTLHVAMGLACSPFTRRSDLNLGY